MFKNRNSDGTLNLCGKKIAALRKERKLSQKQLADKLQLLDLDVGKNTIQQIESGRRFVTDIELKAFALLFNIHADDLIQEFVALNYKSCISKD